MEGLLGQLCCVQGEQGDGTPFRGASIDQIQTELKRAGHDSLGTTTMYNGMTGTKMHGKVFVGPTYYQRLKHMVMDKQHSRSRGPVQILTRQPVEGRAREGGLRFGEMERDWCSIPQSTCQARCVSPRTGHLTTYSPLTLVSAAIALFRTVRPTC